MAESDPYIAYTHRFFRKWAGVYDWFAASIFYAYGAAVRVLHPIAGLRVLDICTGTGEVALRCAARGADVTGLDITPAMLDKARRKAKRRDLAVAFVDGDARRLPYPEKAFEAVVVSFALHDMPRAVRVEVLREAVRVGRARLIVLDYDLPRTHWLANLWMWLIGLFESPYFRSFVRDDTAKLFREAGLPDASVHRVFGWLFSVFEFRLSHESSS